MSNFDRDQNGGPTDQVQAALTATLDPRDRALELRRAGLGYQAIANSLGVALSTAWGWTQWIHAETAKVHDRRSRLGRPKTTLTAKHRANLSRALKAAWVRRRRR